MDSLSLSTSAPSLSLPSLSPLPSLTATATTTATPVFTSTTVSSPSPSTTTPSASSRSPTLSTPSSTSFSATPSATPLPSTSSTSTAPTSVVQNSSSSSTTLTSATATPDPYSSSSPAVVYTPTTTTTSPTPFKSSSTDFLANTGAVAGTFTIVGLVGIAGVIAVVLLIVKRRRSRAYEEDMEYLDKTPDLSGDPPMSHVSSPGGAFTSDHGHYDASPMVIPTPSTTYYPDHPYALHPQAFPVDSSGEHGYPSPYPGGYRQDHTAQRMHPPDQYQVAYPRVAPNMPNPHEFTGVEPDSAPVPPTQTPPPDALRPSVKPSQTVPKQ